MKSPNMQVAVVVVCLLFAVAAQAQEPSRPSATEQAPASEARLAPPETIIPRLVKFSGTLLDAQERPMAGPVGVTFALYSRQTGGAALWVETQNVKPDASGAYVVLLGANSANGLPAELFVSGEARWLGIQVGQQPEHERILLVSVPYALKAGDAETLGGLPASAFVTTGTTAATSSSPTGLPKSSTTTPKKAASTPQPATACTSLTSDGTATANSIGLFTAPCNLQGSVITQSSGNVGFGTAAPAVAVDVVGNNAGLRLSGTGTHQVTVTGASSGRLGEDATGFFFSSDTNGKVIKFLTNNGTLNEWMRITSAGNVGIGTTAPASKLEVDGNTTAVNTAIVTATQAGSTTTPISLTTIPPVAVGGLATATSGFAAGVGGTSFSSSGAGVGALNGSSAGGVGLFAGTAGAGSVGVDVQAGGSAGGTVGIHARTHDTTGAAAVLDSQTTAGTIILGRSHASGVNTNEFRVDGTGKGFFNGGTQTGGADFAESVSVRGARLKYEPGDVLVVDRAAGRQLMLSQRPYSTRVAGIYSTKPGVLATTHSIDESDALAAEVPVAVVGIVPCKVTTQNGPIAPGDLLVTSSTPGYAMKGRNRTRMLGAVVGKALEPLQQGKGVIQVLVTLQ